MLITLLLRCHYATLLRFFDASQRRYFFATPIPAATYSMLRHAAFSLRHRAPLIYALITRHYALFTSCFAADTRR